LEYLHYKWVQLALSEMQNNMKYNYRLCFQKFIIFNVKLMPVLCEFLTDKILDHLSELELKDVSVRSLAACNIMVKCRARM
jgi:hypothetical protein